MTLGTAVLALGLAFAGGKEKHEHREHGAHVHGHGHLDIAFEGAKGRIELRAPSEAFYGFEHEATTAAQKKAVEEAFVKLEKQIGKMIVFEKSLECSFVKRQIETRRETQESGHSETIGAFDIRCKKSPLATKVIFRLRSVFPRLQDVEGTILIDALQKSVDIEKDEVSLVLQSLGG